VVIVGTGSGLSYASLGGTHHSLEEMGMLRLLPGLTVLAPADAMEVRAGLRAALGQTNPAYMRIGKKGEPVIHPAPPELVIGKAITMREGTDVCILSAGNMLSACLHAADLLAARGCSARVVSFHTVKPLDEAMLTDVFANFKWVATAEEHSVLGGLGGSVAEWLSDHPDLGGRLVRFGTRDEFLHETCEQESAREIFGLTPENISSRLMTLWR
jgi:transketolase